jgi:superfamily II DNA/RNA helicase
MTILVATPGRLLQHMDETPGFDTRTVRVLVLDEADRCMDMGFQATMDAIIENMPSQRHTMLFSATQSKKCAPPVLLSTAAAMRLRCGIEQDLVNTAGVACGTATPGSCAGSAILQG